MRYFIGDGPVYRNKIIIAFNSLDDLEGGSFGVDRGRLYLEFDNEPKRVLIYDGSLEELTLGPAPAYQWLPTFSFRLPSGLLIAHDYNLYDRIIGLKITQKEFIKLADKASR